jgi:hypothetical protein
MSLPLDEQYRRYVAAITGAAPDGADDVALAAEAIEAYRRDYLTQLVLAWGGDLLEIFPETTRRLAEHGVGLEAFVPFFYSRPRPTAEPYDYFKIKLAIFQEFVVDRAAGLEAAAGAALTRLAADEAARTLADYDAINEDPRATATESLQKES